MKKIVFFFIVVNAISALYAQPDTIGKYPYLYHYNWPETGIIHDDSVFCNVLMYRDEYRSALEDTDYWNSFMAGVGRVEFAVYQHTDIPLNIIGLAIGNLTGPGTPFSDGTNRETKVVLYDSTMTELASVSGVYYNGDVSTDTNAHHFCFPGIVSITPGIDMTNSPRTYIYYEYFKKEISIAGDYYIGISDLPDVAHNYNGGITLISYMQEWHDEPYNFPDSYFKVKAGDGRWSVLKSQRQFPVLFAILKLPCEPLDSVSVVMGTDGCLHVDWDAPALQSSWTVSLTLPDGSEIVQPTDTNHWEYCGLAPGAYYRVKVRSRCDDIKGHSWSDWSREFRVGNPQAIEAAECVQFSVSPNPASGTVTIGCNVADGMVEVIDMQGRTMLAVPSTKQTLDISHLAAGNYAVRLTTPRGTAVRRLQVK